MGRAINIDRIKESKCWSDMVEDLKTQQKQKRIAEEREKKLDILLKAIDPIGCLIGNNKGNINGWTKQIFGKVIKVI